MGLVSLGETEGDLLSLHVPWLIDEHLQFCLSSTGCSSIPSSQCLKYPISLLQVHSPWTGGLSSSQNKITKRLNIIPAVIAVLYKFTSTGVCDYNLDLSSRGEDPLSGVSPAPLSRSTLSFTSSTAERFIFGWNTRCFPKQQLAHLAPHCLKPYTNLFPLPSLLP